MERWDDKVKSKVVELIKEAGAGPTVFLNRICFSGTAPRRTFEIRKEGAQSFRVRETTGCQTAGKSAEPSRFGDRDMLTESEMICWLTDQLNQLRTA
jgi:hypothetical protein